MALYVAPATGSGSTDITLPVKGVRSILIAGVNEALTLELMNGATLMTSITIPFTSVTPFQLDNVADMSLATSLVITDRATEAVNTFLAWS